MSVREDLFNYYSSQLPRLYQGLRAVNVTTERYCEPQLPYVGGRFEDGRARLLIVGKAPNRWYGYLRCSSSADESLQRSVRFIEGRVMPFYGRLPVQDPEGSCQTRFWQRVYLLDTRASQGQPGLSYERREDWARACFRELAWTNVFKIGNADWGNPDPEMCEFLLQNFKFLSDEIGILKPHAVIFSTGTGYDKYLARCFGGNLQLTPDPCERRVSSVGSRLGCLAYRTPHFMVLKNSALDRVSHLINQGGFKSTESAAPSPRLSCKRF